MSLVKTNHGLFVPDVDVASKSFFDCRLLLAMDRYLRNNVFNSVLVLWDGFNDVC